MKREYRDWIGTSALERISRPFTEVRKIGDATMAHHTPTLDRYIEVTPGVAGGEPRIAGHRITVRNVAIWHERLGHSADEIAADYDLTLAEVYSALAYYFDHKQEIDASIEASSAFVDALRKATPSKLPEKLRGQNGSSLSG